MDSPTPHAVRTIGDVYERADAALEGLRDLAADAEVTELDPGHDALADALVVARAVTPLLTADLTSVDGLATPS